MKLSLVCAAVISASFIGAYTQFTTDQCGLVYDSERRSILNTITSATIKELGLKRSLNESDVCYMPVAKLKRAIYRTEMPKPDHPGEAAEFRYQSLLNEHGQLDTVLVNKAKDQVNTMKRLARFDAGITNESWEALGPGNIGGRIRSFVFDPNNANRIIAGSVSGGLWQTTDAGGVWNPVDDFMANLAITTLTYDPSNNNVLYAGTGEGFFNGDAIRGLGIYKSVDNGVTWDALESTTTNTDFNYVNRITMKTDGTAIFSATNGGIWRSMDDGASWQEIHAGMDYVIDDESGESVFAFARVQDLDIAPNNDQHLIAGARGAPLYSEDGGNTWQAASPFPLITEYEEDGQTYKEIDNFRVETAFSKSSPNVVYASVDRNGGEVYRSNDGGKSFELVNTGTSYLGGQGWYDNALWVDPVDPDHIIVGGIDLWRSQDGGNTFSQISTWWASPYSAHADHHFVMAHPDYDGTTNKAVYFANDGGMYMTNDLDAIVEDRVNYTFSGWNELNNNLGITQFYGLGVAPDGTIIGGTQDNGTLVLKPGADSESWYDTFGGDGGYSVADPTDSNYLYGEYVYLRIHRSTNGGLAWPEPGYSNYIYDPAMEEGALFIAPFILDQNNPNRMLAGSNKLWVSDNVKDEVPNWTVLKPVTETEASIKSIAVAQGNSDLIVIGYNNGEIYKTVNGTEETPEWQRIDLTDMPTRSNYRLAIDPLDHNTFYASFSGYAENNFWRTEDGGVTWQTATGQGLESLPPAPIRGIAIHPTKTNRIYLGTELGVFTSEDKGNSWSISNDGPANVAIDELIWQDENTLLAATHGRGIFRATITEDNTPDAYTFGRLDDVAVNSSQTSTIVTMSGLSVRAAISVNNGQYTTNCDADQPVFTSETGKVKNGDRVCVRHTSSENTNTETITTLTVGTSSANFITKTELDLTPDAMVLGSNSGVALGTVQTSSTVTINGIDAAVDISIANGEYAKDCDANSFTADASTISEGETLCVRHTSSNSYSTSVTTTITVGGTTANFSSTTQADPNANSGSNNSGGSSGSLFWLLPLTLLGLRRRKG